jgi:universal stress protein A
MHKWFTGFILWYNSKIIKKEGCMKQYNRIIVALELFSDADKELLEQSRIILRDAAATITLVHAVEHAGAYGPYGIGIEVEQELLKAANQEMQSIGRQLGLPERNLIVKIGPAKFVILEEAERIDADLIIIGSHGRHGLRAILGSTANAVLHGAKCDVLAVRLKE